ncbi:MAG: Sensor histidine kinase RcsC [Anaerolineae bacterium]|nr:Sensor histidine kinase RcsC [Anaerolineae bacterium]
MSRIKLNWPIKLAPDLMALIYFLAASIWILLSDKLVSVWITDPDILTRIQTYKGWGFVVVTTLLLYLLLHFYRRQITQYVDERQQIEVTLSETTRQYRTLVENLNGMVYHCQNDPDWTMEYVSAGSLTLTGYQPGELIGSRVVRYGDLIHPDDRTTVWDAVQTAIEQQNPFILIYRLITKTGEEKWVREQGRAIFSAAGELEALEGIIIDITEQQKIRLNQQESEAFYRGLFEEHPAIMFLINPDDNSIVDVNQAACNFYGWSRDDLRQMNISQINALSAAEIQAELQRAEMAGQNQFFFKHRQADGSIRDVEVFSGPIKRHGKTLRFSIIQDITERRWAEEQLSLNLERLSLATASAGIGIWDANVRTGNLIWDNRMYELYGLDQKKIRASYETWAQTLHPDDLPAVNVIRLAALENSQNYHAQYRIFRPDGEMRHIEAYATIQRDDAGQPLRIIGVNRDITDQMLATRALERSEARYRLLFDNNPHPMWVNNLEDLTFMAVNNAAVARYGYSREEFLAMTIKDICPAEDVSNLLADVDRERPVLQHSGEWRHRLKDGQIIDVEIDSHLIEFDGQPAALVLAQDITDRKQLEEENVKLTTQFYQAQKMEAIGQLAGGIAHDFNNLLVPIMGYAEMGQMTLSPDDPLQANFNHISQAADRAANLTRQILAFSRQQILEMKVLDLNQVVTDFQEMLGRLLPESINLHIHLNPRLRLITADQGQLEQVLMNLAINARDAMPGGGVLTIETDLAPLDQAYASLHSGAKPGLYVLLAISDTGHGMDAATQQRIFEPFFTTKGRGHGTGLGLATVFGIIKQHQGNIWVYSEPGQGTTFKIYLPVVSDQRIQSPVHKDTPIDQLTGSETVLIVEDEDGVRQLVIHALQACGYQVLEAASPAQALELVAGYTEVIHLLLTDVIMPEMNGRQLYTRLVQQRPDLLVLFMSGYTDNVIVHHGALDPDVAFLAKPFSMQTLLQKVREVLKQ